MRERLYLSAGVLGRARPTRPPPPVVRHGFRRFATTAISPGQQPRREYAGRASPGSGPNARACLRSPASAPVRRAGRHNDDRHGRWADRAPASQCPDRSCARRSPARDRRSRLSSSPRRSVRYPTARHEPAASAPSASGSSTISTRLAVLPAGWPRASGGEKSSPSAVKRGGSARASGKAGLVSLSEPAGLSSRRQMASLSPPARRPLSASPSCGRYSSTSSLLCSLNRRGSKGSRSKLRPDILDCAARRLRVAPAAQAVFDLRPGGRSAVEDEFEQSVRRPALRHRHRYWARSPPRHCEPAIWYRAADWPR